MALHTQRKCFKPLKEQKGMERAECRAGIPEQCCPYFHYVCKISYGLREYQAMITRVWL